MNQVSWRQRYKDRVEDGTMDKNPLSSGVDTRPGGRSGDQLPATAQAAPRRNPAKIPNEPGTKTLAERLGLPGPPKPPAGVTYEDTHTATPMPIPVVTPAEPKEPAAATPLDLSNLDGNKPPVDTAAADGTEEPVTLNPDSVNNDAVDDEGQDFLGDDDDDTPDVQP
jgi:hypothetical protein